MSRTDFWKEEGYFEEADIKDDIKRLSPEQMEQYLIDLKKEIVDNGWNDQIHVLLFSVDSTIIEKYPDYFMELVKIDPGEISYIPKTVLKDYPEALKDVPEEVWKRNFLCMNVGNIPSEIAKKYKGEFRDRIAKIAEPDSFINVQNLPIETVRENPWLLTDIIEITSKEYRVDMISKLPEDIKTEYSELMQKACELFGKIDTLQEMIRKADDLAFDIDQQLREALSKDEKKRVGEDGDGIR